MQYNRSYLRRNINKVIQLFCLTLKTQIVYINMAGAQECRRNNSNFEEGLGELPRPPISNYERILNGGLRPHRVFNIDEVIKQKTC